MPDYNSWFERKASHSNQEHARGQEVAAAKLNTLDDAR